MNIQNAAILVLKEAGKPFHVKEITQHALEASWLKSSGKTPEATMNGHQKTFASRSLSEKPR